MRICLISSDYNTDGPHGAGGGIETYVRLMGRGLAAAGHDVYVIAPTRSGTRTFVDGAVRVHAIHIDDEWRGGSPELGEARAALSFAWHARLALHRLIDRLGPFDIVEAPEYKGQALFLADDDVPLVVKCHAHVLLCLDLNGELLSPGTALLADMERETLEKARAVHANSRALAARCASDYGLPRDRFAHVPYGIDTEVFRPTPSALRDELGLRDSRIVLFVGRMEGRKGIVPLVEAFAEVVRRVPDAVLLLVGPDVNGPPAFDSNAAWMRRSWDAAGVPADRVRFIGTVPNHTLPALYSAADVMVAPSPYEAFGLVYVEAMACGCPPIGCNAGGAPEVIRHGETGMLVPPNDAPALAGAIVDLLGGDRAALGASGRALVEREFSLGAMVDRTISFYEEALA